MNKRIVNSYAKVGREDIFELTIRNESLHEINMIMELEW
jgi:hypothetical protein